MLCADGQKLNSILGAKTFNHQIIYEDEVRDSTGLDIQELFLCWIFASQNRFEESLKEWKKSGKLMDFGEIQGF